MTTDKQESVEMRSKSSTPETEVQRLEREVGFWQDQVERERSKADTLREENDRLRKFTDHILEGYSWGHDVDGGDAQEKAVELGLVELRPIDPEDSIDGETEHYFTKWTPKEEK